MQLKENLQTHVKTRNIKKQYLLLGSLIVIGVLLRLPSLKLGVWRDEGSTYFNALPTNLHEVINTVIYSELNPPGFYLIMHKWIQWFGADDVIFKLPVFIFGILLIPATYTLGSLISSPKIGLIAAAVTTFEPNAIYYSQEARPYTLAALLCCLILILYCKAINSDKQIWYLIGLVICADIMLYVQYTSLILLASLAIVTVYLWWSGVANIRPIRFVIAGVIIFLLFTPWLKIFLIHLSTGLPWLTKKVWFTRPKLLYDIFLYTLPVTKLQKYLVGIIVIFSFAYQARQLFSRSQQLTALKNTTIKTYTLILYLSVLLTVMLLAALSYSGRYVFPFAPLAWVVYTHSVVNLFQSINNYRTAQLYRFSKQVAVVLLVTFIIFPNIK
ncbi:glycosyltransferase family 39 protein [Nostoc sp. MS1]|uniref:glycosyltransferase family 39 protein n=1 Tax=Nostoc sp. MS1 TaxID=2764711 RepID=UPI001CC659A4|nr:glycosyltransferase family 39 protein [Nostoc sp. MS1]